MRTRERGAAAAVRRGARRTAATAAITLAAAAGMFALVGTMQADADTTASGNTGTSSSS
jgi:hypothetical protein